MSVTETLNERGNNYGKFEDNSRITELLWSCLTDAPNFDKLTDCHILAYRMILHKIARSVCGDPMYADNAHDIAGYAKLLEDHINEANK